MNRGITVEYIKTTIILSVLLVTVLCLTDILNLGISALLLNVFLLLFSLITIIQNSKENKINPVEEDVEIHKSPKKKQCHPFCENIQLAIGVTLIAIAFYSGGGVEFVSDAFAPIFGGSTIQTEIIDKVGYPVEVSDTYEGITISVDEIIGDSHNVCVLFTIANEDGTPFALPEGVHAEDLFYGGECFGTNFPHKKGELHWWSKSKRVVESKSEDGALQIIEMFSTDDPLVKGKKVTARFDKIYYLDENEDKSISFFERIGIPVLEGKWRLRYELDYEDTDVTIPVDEQFTRDDLPFTVKDITLSNQ